MNDEHPKYEWQYDKSKDECVSCQLHDAIRTEHDRDVLLTKLRQVENGKLSIKQWRKFVKDYARRKRGTNS